MIVRRSLLWAGAMVALLLPSSLRADRPPEPPPFGLDRLRDLAASVRARRVLKDDRDLARLNLGVSVEDGVATVRGPVPSDAEGRRAVALLEGVRGIRAVRAVFYPETPHESNLLGGLSRRPQLPQRFEASKPTAEAETPPRLPRVTQPAVVTHGSSGPVAPQVFAPRAVALPPRAPDPPPGSLRDRIAAIRAADARFGTIPILIDGTRLPVQQGAAEDGVIRALLDRLRRVPGVTEVELKSE
jgi:hypothetical protein